MEYNFDIDRWGGFFSVPIKIVNEYIKISDGNFIKVLMCILASSERKLTSENLSYMSGLPCDVCDDAVAHWVNLGVISAGYKLDNKPDVNPNYEPVRPETKISPAVTETSAEIIPKNQNNDTDIDTNSDKNQENKKPKTKIVIKYSQKEILEKSEKDPNFKSLITEIQGILQFSLNAMETGKLIELYDVYRFDVATILLAAQYCADLGKRSIAYMSAVMVRWFEEDITSYTEVEAEIIKYTAIDDFEHKCMHIFGINTKPSKTQKEYMAMWYEQGVSVEMVEIAYDKCMTNTSKLNFKYMNVVISDWLGKNISTPEQIAKEDFKFKNGSTNNKSYKKQAQLNNQKQHSYDLSDFEKLALNFNPNKKGDK